MWHDIKDNSIYIRTFKRNKEHSALILLFVKVLNSVEQLRVCEWFSHQLCQTVIPVLTIWDQTYYMEVFKKHVFILRQKIKENGEIK
jgi:5-deoxy-D-glucuronate isomerase